MKDINDDGGLLREDGHFLLLGTGTLLLVSEREEV